ncbi:MAG TPA: type IV pilus secretin PilQ [Candidatus Limnocylindria bacterium]|nr:type IV pilus secretin PilQ [Candidatus Limnocylindria bacterium]
MKTNWPALRHSYLILASLVLASSPVHAQSQVPAGVTATVAVISNVAITQAPQRAAVRVEGEGLLDVHAGRMQNPDRLVLDFAGARVAVEKTVIPGISAPVRGVRIGQYRPDVARVVVDLTTASRYQISRDGDAVVIYFATPSTTPVEPVSSVTTTLRQSEKTRPEFRYSAASPRLVAGSSRDWTISAPRFALPGELTQPSVTLASFGGKKEPVRPDSTTQQAAAQQAVQQANTAATTMAASSATQAPAGAAPAPAAGKYTGEPISVNLKDVDLKDFFRLIHEISGLNVVLDPAVKGSLTIVLDEVPWDQALDIVMQNNSLDKQLNGNVLRIATRSTLKNEAETQRDLEKAQAEAIAPVTVTRVLSYAKAASMAPTLKKFLSSRGDILFDDRSNQIIIRDIPSVIPVIDNLIRQLDRKSQQVEIEARVVSASRSFARDIGTQLAFSGTGLGGRNIIGGDSDVGKSTFGTTNPAPPVSITNSTPPVMPFVSNLAAGAPTSGLLLAHRSTNFAVDFFITAAEAKGVGKLLSKPKVITQNNEKATVKQGTKIPIQTTINNTISVQFIDAVLKLEVTPQITAEGTVFMDVLVENTQIDNGIPRVSGIPALNTQSAETKVTVADGGTVVIGGVIISSQRTDIQQVPLVGSLPLIGHLFKRTSVTTTSQELMFFLTPRIIPG